LLRKTDTNEVITIILNRKEKKKSVRSKNQRKNNERKMSTNINTTQLQQQHQKPQLISQKEEKERLID